jgi:CHAT domain-containing protein
MLLQQTPPTFAADLLVSIDPLSLLETTVYDPLDLLVELHQYVTRSILHDLPYAQRVAALVAQIAARHPDDLLVQAQHHWTQGAAIVYVPDHAGALAHFDQALALYEEAAAAIAPIAPRRDIRVVQVVRVFCLTELGRYSEALATVEIAERWLAEFPNEYARLTLLLNRSLLAGSMGQYEQMIELSDAIIELAPALGQQARLAQAWINRGFACTALGRFIEAEHAIEQGCAIATNAGESLTLARGQWNRARLLRLQGKLFVALQTLDQARKGMAQARGEVATVALEAAAIALRLQQLPEAWRAAQEAILSYAAQELPAYSTSAALQAVQVAIRYGHSRAAKAAFAHAREQAANAQRPLLDAELVLAEAHLATREPPAPAALRRLRKRLANAITALQDADLTLEAAEGRLVAAALAARHGQLEAARQEYTTLIDHQSVHVRLAALGGLATLLPPAEALPYLRTAAELATAERRMLPAEELQARYASETSPQLLQLAQAQLDLGETGSALESVWAAKIGTLLDLRASQGGNATALQTLIHAARAAIRVQRESYNEHAHKAQVATIGGQHERAYYHLQRAEAARGEAQESERLLSETIQKMGERSGQASIPTLAELQAALSPQSMVLEYVAFGDTLGCFVVQQQSVRYHRLGALKDLDELLDRWTLLCGRGEADITPAQIAMVLDGLARQLLTPFAEELQDRQHLLIAPYGVLNRLPWPALVTRRWAIPEVVLLPGGGLWATQLPPASEPPGPPRLLSYAGEGTRQLAAVEQELAAIAPHLPGAVVQHNAPIAAVQQRPAPALLHIAAHGSTNSAAPLCSTIELADGPFLLLEAYHLDLRGTAMVVLSACETGVVPDQGGVALALIGGFLCAGAAAVVASLWAVNDNATRNLMEHFYAHLASGLRPAQALIVAANAIRNDHPLDWAAFQLWVGGAS